MQIIILTSLGVGAVFNEFFASWNNNRSDFPTVCASTDF